jgi:hypothetical protein
MCPTCGFNIYNENPLDHGIGFSCNDRKDRVIIAASKNPTSPHDTSKLDPLDKITEELFCAAQVAQIDSQTHHWNLPKEYDKEKLTKARQAIRQEITKAELKIEGIRCQDEKIT